MNRIFRGLNMKNRFLSFLRRYWICILLSVIMVIGLHLSSRYADLYETGSAGDMIRFDLYDLYIVYAMPLYSLVYGCLSYIIVKKTWFPQLILFGVTFIYWFISGIEALFWEGTYILSAVPIIFSLIGAGIASFIYNIIKSIKKNDN